MAVRVLSIVIVVIVVVYHALRLAGSQCAGAACDWYIPFSLLLPIAALVLAGVTGALAASEARGRGGWPILLASCAVLGAVGPVVVALVLKDNDLKVWTSTALVLTVPVTVAMAAARRPSRIN